jgi:hypothetical protein
MRYETVAVAVAVFYPSLFTQWSIKNGMPGEIWRRMR